MPKTIFRFQFHGVGQILFFVDENEGHAWEILRVLKRKNIKGVLFRVNGRVAGVSVRTMRSREEIIDLIMPSELG